MQSLSRGQARAEGRGRWGYVIPARQPFWSCRSHIQLIDPNAQETRARHPKECECRGPLFADSPRSRRAAPAPLSGFPWSPLVPHVALLVLSGKTFVRKHNTATALPPLRGGASTVCAAGGFKSSRSILQPAPPPSSG
jgi:hypothetical protein